MITEAQRRRWELERAAQEQLYKLLSEKVARIRRALTIETDPSRKFQYEQQIQEEENELKKFDDRLNEIEAA